LPDEAGNAANGAYVKPRDAVTCGDPRPVLDVQLSRPFTPAADLRGVPAAGTGSKAVSLQSYQPYLVYQAW
jgi:hypothetical protein